MKEKIEYQICPSCYGQGTQPLPSQSQTSSITTIPCGVCNGEKFVIKSREISDDREKLPLDELANDKEMCDAIAHVVLLRKSERVVKEAERHVIYFENGYALYIHFRGYMAGLVILRDDVGENTIFETLQVCEIISSKYKIVK